MFFVSNEVSYEVLFLSPKKVLTKTYSNFFPTKFYYNKQKILLKFKLLYFTCFDVVVFYKVVILSYSVKWI